MCTVCGCGPGETRIEGSSDHAGHEHEHIGPDGTVTRHSHHHGHTHDHEIQPSRLIKVEQDILAKNNRFAAVNRQLFAASNTLTLNLMSSPGSGKTTLLVRTLTDLGGRLNAGVIEGDQETSLDADRIRATGRPVIQINTGAGCHLDADMLRHGLDALSPGPGSTVFIENVGNLVCPALFDLGETAKVVIVSVTEGDDKPQKYPHMFMAADLVIVNKSDLLPYVDFDVDECLRRIRQINPRAEFLTLSATTGEGLADWYGWLDGASSPAAAPTPGAARSEPLTGSLTEAH